MRTIFTGLVLFVLAAALAIGQQKKAPQQSNTGRFSMVAAEVREGIGGPGTITATLFVIDSQTGRVWRWMPDYESKTGKLIPAHFEAVAFVKYGETIDHQMDHPE